MGIIVLLISISVTVALLFLFIFIWNMKSGQYDDTYTPAVRILFDETPQKAPSKKQFHQHSTTAKKTSDPATTKT